MIHKNFQIIDFRTRPQQDVDVLTVLDFQIPCFRPENPAFYLTNHFGGSRPLDENWDVRDDFKDGNESFKDPGR